MLLEGCYRKINNIIIIIINDARTPQQLLRTREKVFKTIIRPAMTYGSECWAVKNKDESKLN